MMRKLYECESKFEREKQRDLMLDEILEKIWNDSHYSKRCAAAWIDSDESIITKLKKGECMLSVKLKYSSKKVFVSFCDDNGINKGGYYCQVYDDEMLKHEIDNFVIHKEDLAGLSGTEKLHAAYKIASKIVRETIQ